VAEGGGLLNRTGFHQTRTKQAKTRDFLSIPLDRISVLCLPMASCAVTITAQFAALDRQHEVVGSSATGGSISTAVSSATGGSYSELEIPLERQRGGS